MLKMILRRLLIGQRVKGRKRELVEMKRNCEAKRLD